MDCQFIRGTLKTTVGLLLMVIGGLLSPRAMAQEEVPTIEGKVQRLEEVPIPSGTVQQLEGVGTRNLSESPWSFGSSSNDEPENYSSSLNLDYKFNEGDKAPFNYESTFDVWNLGLRIYPTGENWFSLNRGLTPRGHVAIPFIRF